MNKILIVNMLLLALSQAVLELKDYCYKCDVKTLPLSLSLTPSVHLSVCPVWQCSV